MAQTNNAALNYEGIYAQSNALLTTHQSLPDAVYASNAITGVSLNLVWSSIEPSKGHYDWSTLDAEVTRALASGKELSLTVTPNRPDAPSWLFDAGAKAYDFNVSQHGSVRPQSIQVAAPWDPVYQAGYADMMKAMADHLKSIPGAYDAVSVVKITGIGQITGELKLPVGNAKWQAAGYTPDKVIDAWKGFATATNNAFSDKILGIAATEKHNFPMIDNNGNIVTAHSPTYVDVTSQIISAGLDMFGGRFMVQWCGLGAGHLSNVVTAAEQQGAIAAYQTDHHLKSGLGIGVWGSAVTPTDATYEAALRDGVVNGGAQYLEVWAADALKYTKAMDDIAALINNLQNTSDHSVQSLSIGVQASVELHSTDMTVNQALNNTGDLYIDNSTVVAHGDLLNRGSITADGVNALFKADEPGATSTVVNSGEISATNGGHVQIAENLNNQDGGKVDADSHGNVEIDGAVSNKGVLEAEHGGTLTINGAVTNTGGTVISDDAFVFMQSISGTGQMIIQDAGKIEIGGAAAGHVVFDTGAHGTLVVDQSAVFKADVAGFGSGDSIDLSDINFAGTTLRYVADSGGAHSGVLRIQNAANEIVAKVKFVGDYTTADFTAGNDGHGHVLVQHHDLLV